MRRWRGVLLAVVALSMSACTFRLTPDGSPYAVADTSGTIQVTGAAGSGNNERELIWPKSGAMLADSNECATWESGSGLTQDGLAFRINLSNGGYNAIVLERNIWMAQFGYFAAISFGANGMADSTVTVLGNVDLTGYLGTSPTDVFPLRVCAAVAGDVLSFAVAKGTDPMPALGTVGQGGAFQISGYPASQPGRTGLYVGHIPPGTTASIDGVSIDGTPEMQTLQ